MTIKQFMPLLDKLAVCKALFFFYSFNFFIISISWIDALSYLHIWMHQITLYSVVLFAIRSTKQLACEHPNKDMGFFKTITVASNLQHKYRNLQIHKRNIIIYIWNITYHTIICMPHFCNLHALQPLICRDVHAVSLYRNLPTCNAPYVAT